MRYIDLVNGLKKYGSDENDICLHGLGIQTEQVRENVIIAPWWEPLSIPGLGTTTYLSNSEFDSVKVWNICNEKLNMTYIKTGIGAPVLMDVVLSLGVTRCKKIIFVGSVGSLDQKIGIGDIVIPEYSICGDGASRYIASSDLDHSDCFGEKVYPDSMMFERIKTITKQMCEKYNVKWHIGQNYSIDTIVAQFAHVDAILNKNCNVIEMETAAAFRAAKLAEIAIAAIFSVSDNTVCNKSLVSGRTKEEMDYRKFVRRNLFSQIILRTFATRC